jgi:hypothetical protein
MGVPRFVNRIDTTYRGTTKKPLIEISGFFYDQFDDLVNSD